MFKHVSHNGKKELEIEKKEEKQDVEKNSYIFFAHVTQKTWPIDKTLQNLLFLKWLHIELNSVHKSS